MRRFINCCWALPLPAFAALSLLTAGCGAAGPGEAGITRTDSAGVAIVESRSPVWGAADAWRIGAEPVLQIGVVEGEPAYQFSGINAVRRLADGGFMVAQRAEIRLYDAAGGYLRTLGRAGNGPGEFLVVGSAVECGGEIVALDWAAARLTRFKLDGTLSSTRSLAPFREAGIAPVSVSGCVRGEPVLWVNPVTTPTSGPPALVVTRRPLALVRLDPAMTTLDTLLSMPGSENLAGLNPPFGKLTAFALAESSIYATTNDDDEIRTYSLDGALERIGRRVRPAVEVTAENVARIREQYLNGLPPALLQEIEPRFDAAPIPKTMPFISQLLEDGAGHIWARSYSPFRGDEVPRWSVFSPDGAWLGEVELPAELSVHEIGPDYILGVWKDELDVEYLRLHPIIRE